MRGGLYDEDGVLVALHCVCGTSSPEWGPPIAGCADEEDAKEDALQAFTAAWWKVHCGPGHGPSDKPVPVPSEKALLGSLVKDVVR